ncbi:uncharacterized protein [Dysidea avara]|uniref:uncharacterized protein isoform X2 n=1 Tax=Dysidea avara TaxID=196820 RepID=UPI0033167AEA
MFSQRRLKQAIIIIYCIAGWGWYNKQRTSPVLPRIERNSDAACKYPSCDNYTKPNCNRISSILSDYAEHHKQVVMQKKKGKFLKFVCNRLCGGYGNRILGITVTLLLAIASNRTFLIEMNHPFNINELMHPNAIKWNYVPPQVLINTRVDFSLVDNRHRVNWPEFSKAILDDTKDMVAVSTNYGFEKVFPLFEDYWIKLLKDQFGITKTDNNFSFGCVTRYLFVYDKIVTDAINKEMQDLHLTPGLYVSAHLRTKHITGDVHPAVYRSPIHHFQCCIAVAKKLSSGSKFPVYFISDSEWVDNLANELYSGDIVTSPVHKIHVDRAKQHGLSTDSLIDGFIGALVNVEVASRGAAFVRTGSSFADVIQSIGQFPECSVIWISV